MPFASSADLASIAGHVENLYEDIRDLRAKINMMVLQSETREMSTLHLAPLANSHSLTNARPPDKAA